jgi:hypothetical protein
MAIGFNETHEQNATFVLVKTNIISCTKSPLKLLSWHPERQDLPLVHLNTRTDFLPQNQDTKRGNKQLISFSLHIFLTPVTSGSSAMCLLLLPGSHVPCHQVIARRFINLTAVLCSLCGLWLWETILPNYNYCQTLSWYGWDELKVNGLIYCTTGCCKLTSFFIWIYSYKKGSIYLHLHQVPPCRI